MPDLSGKVGELHFTLQITRKETGKTETVELVGFIDEQQLETLQKEASHDGRNE